MKKEAQVNTTSAGAVWKFPEFDLVVKDSKTLGKGLHVTVITAKGSSTCDLTIRMNSIGKGKGLRRKHL